MQQIVEAVRNDLTAAQVRYLIQEAPAIIVSAGLEATDITGLVYEDVTDDFLGGSVSRSSYATLHGTATLNITRPLEWGYQVVRPYMVISDGTIEARFNLGAYFTNTPSRVTGENPPTYEVQCFDLLYRLDQNVGAAYSIGAGQPILSRIAEILDSLGFVNYIIDYSRINDVAPDSKTWALDDNLTWLSIVNDLLAMVGYRGIWSDWNGYLRCEAYQEPTTRPSEWTFDDNQTTTLMEPGARITFDYHSAFNRWVGIRQNNPEGQPPIEGNGVYTLENQSDGPTSIDARGGLSITRQESFDVVGHADLITAVQSMASADMTIPTTIEVSTAPFPLAWHFDRYTADDPDIGGPTEVLATSWTLPLNGDAMTHSWTLLSGAVS